MNRKNFIQSQGATCRNWQWSWAFINDAEKVIIFGAWDEGTVGNTSIILEKAWEYNYKNQKNRGYGEALDYIDLIQNKGYQLKTFPIYYSDERKDDQGRGPSKIERFDTTLTNKKLLYSKGVWYAVDENEDSGIPEVINEAETLLEGAKIRVTVNAYERNGKARAICINHYGYKCAVCDFDFADFYGSIGENYIHVHHIVPLSQIQKEYKLDPIKDLIPVCPNCHAMIHRTPEALAIEELKSILKKQSKNDSRNSKK